MKRSDIAFYTTCLAFGLLNNFHGWINVLYTCFVISIAIIISNSLKKYDKKPFKHIFFKYE